MRYRELLEIIADSEAQAWLWYDGDPENFTYKEDLNVNMKLHHTYSEGDQRPYKSHDWATRFPNKSAYHCYVDIFFQNNIVKEYALVTCDKGSMIVRDPLLPPPDAPMEDTLHSFVDAIKKVEPNLVISKFMCNLGCILSRHYTKAQYIEKLNSVGIEVEDMDDDLDVY